MGCALETLARSTVTSAEVLVTSALDTPSSFKSAACTFGGHPDAHLRPERTRETGSVVAASVTVAPKPLPAPLTALMSCSSVTLLRSIVTSEEVLVTSALDTPSSFKSAACTFGGHPDAHLRPVRVSDTVSVLTSSAAA